MSTATPPQAAILGGSPTIDLDEVQWVFDWPIVTEADEQAVVAVMRSGNTSGTDISKKFEAEYAPWQGTRFALAHCNGTSALLAAMYGVGLGAGDEMIVPSCTYWASAVQCLLLGAVPVFADIDPNTLCIDPADIERWISPRTRAIMVTHYGGHPCDMDAIMAIASKHGLKVIEDNSHAHGSRYRGRKCGALGHVSAASMMGRKSFVVGEGGMLCTDDQEIYERAIALMHYERYRDLTDEHLIAITRDERGLSLPLAGLKGRMNQMGSAMGRVQLRHYDERIAEIDRAMTRFCDLIEAIPGLTPIRTPAGSTQDTMGGWYACRCRYDASAFDGLPVDRFVAALQAENVKVSAGMNPPIHLHPYMNEVDAFGEGKPTRLARATRDVRQPAGSLPVSERILGEVLALPWFKRDHEPTIQAYARAFEKVAGQASEIKRHHEPERGKA